MTNKTREKIEDLFLAYHSGQVQCFLDSDGHLHREELIDGLCSLVKQSENRILRKWKKAMEKHYDQFEEFTGLKVDYLDYDKMEEEYLKAKGE